MNNFQIGDIVKLLKNSQTGKVISIQVWVKFPNGRVDWEYFQNLELVERDENRLSLIEAHDRIVQGLEKDPLYVKAWVNTLKNVINSMPNWSIGPTGLKDLPKMIGKLFGARIAEQKDEPLLLDDYYNRVKEN